MPLTDVDLQELTTPQLNIKDNTLDQNDLAYRCPLDNGRHTTNPEADLGELALLPPELLHRLLRQLDIQSLTDLRRVNQQAMILVDSVPEYRVIVTHAPNALRGMLCLGSARSNSCYDLYQKLCTAECDTCGDFGGYLYLITCRRVCFTCLSDEVSYLPLRKADVIRDCGIESKHLGSIPHVRSRPGRYSPNSKIYRKSVTLYDRDASYRAAISIYGTEGNVKGAIARKIDERFNDFHAKQSTYESGGRLGRKPRRPRTEEVWDATSGNPHRFLAVVGAPHYDVHTRRATDGFYCRGCRDEHVGPDLHWRRRFTIETFERHWARFGAIINGFHSNSSKKRTPMA